MEAWWDETAAIWPSEKLETSQSTDRFEYSQAKPKQTTEYLSASVYSSELFFCWKKLYCMSECHPSSKTDIYFVFFCKMSYKNMDG